jgi:hypothetical protein
MYIAKKGECIETSLMFVKKINPFYFTGESCCLTAGIKTYHNGRFAG